MQKKKIIINFIVKNKINISNQLSKKNITNITKRKIFKLKNNTIIWNGLIILNSIKKISKIIKIYNNLNENVLFLGNSPFLKIISIMFPKKKNHIILISNWLPGLLTNWEKTQSFLNSNFIIFAKKSKKLRFLKTFSKIKNKKKPSIVVVYSNNITDTVINKECFINNIPVIFVIQQNILKNTSYALCSNNQNLSSQWFFIQVFLNL